MEDVEKLQGDVHLPLRVKLKRTYSYIRPELKRFLPAVLLLIVNVALDLVLPMFVSRITDNLESSSPSLRLIVWLAVCYVGIGVINQIVLFFEAVLLQHAGQNVIYRLRTEVYDHIEHLSLNQLGNMPVGSLVTRVTSYTAAMSDLFTDVLIHVLRYVTTIAGVYGVMLYISYRLALMMLGFIVVVFVSSYVFGKIVGAILRTERRNVSELNTFLNENLSGMRLIQIFNREKRKEWEFMLRNEKLHASRYKMVIAFGLYRPFITFLYLASIALSFYVGVKIGLQPGMIVAFYLYLSKFFNPIQNLADQLNHLQKAFTASERLFNLLDVQPEVRDAEDAEDVEHFDGKIEFKNVWFAYKGEDWILKDVSFTVEKGQTCAFVGATGAGKTTILSLLVRAYEIQKGQILIDGRDIRTVTVRSLRRGIGQMLQDVVLFTDTVKNNLTLGDEDFTDAQIEAACAYVKADAFIERLPHGMDEQLSERGSNLSQGQRQLLSFARTVLHRPQILTLDEATANIDTETEALIQQSLENMRSIGTMLVVAHRLSTVRDADKILVLQNGELIESGTHAQLMAREGYYKKLYTLQLARTGGEG